MEAIRTWFNTGVPKTNSFTESSVSQRDKSKTTNTSMQYYVPFRTLFRETQTDRVRIEPETELHYKWSVNSMGLLLVTTHIQPT